ncbi:S8 family serine peptidase [Sphingomonas sp. HDW15A]|uniref:S8 family serine peptidase n=1 Tax=Sphingomonas sp. HDW15A TaxID=2714942 RepID=UPI00140A4F0F|nr:S8 family serine peptidase [Sphingomonas sp. HDW15A]QIK95819.1 S8 family serine peptidase [Sphingomonas sp. HDW15A]
MRNFSYRLLAGLTVTSIAATAAGAQLLGGGGIGGVQLPPVDLRAGEAPVVGPVLGPVLNQRINSGQAQEVIRPTLNSVAGLPDAIAEAGPATLSEIRKMRLRELIRANRRELESDGRGQPVRRGVLIVINPDPSSLQQALRAGFRIAADDRIEELGMRSVTLAVPRGDSAPDALRKLAKVAPALQADFDHVYEPAGGSLSPLAAAALASSSGSASGRRIGMIDGGVASHPSMSGAGIEQRGFAGKAAATGHGTAVASLIVGKQGPFNGAAQGANLLVADVYGGNQAAGSASTIVKALAWLSAKGPAVINISLVGPSNKMVGRAIEIVRQRGQTVVAAVGNDGPAAPPQYPASYPGVIAVTGVDARGRALAEAGRAGHLDFAAPGADMAAASPGSGYAKVRGTSFAAPLVTSRIAVTGSARALVAEARPGRGKVGRGVVCSTCRTDPKAVRVK